MSNNISRKRTCINNLYHIKICVISLYINPLPMEKEIYHFYCTVIPRVKTRIQDFKRPLQWIFIIIIWKVKLHYLWSRPSCNDRLVNYLCLYFYFTHNFSDFTVSVVVTQRVRLATMYTIWVIRSATSGEIWIIR